MEENVVKISRSSDTEGAILLLVFIFVCCGIVAIVKGLVVIGILAILFSGAFFTLGNRTIIDFEKKTIKNVTIIFFIEAWTSDKTISVGDYDIVVLNQYSETGGAQFRSHSSSFTIREYHVMLSSSNSNAQYNLPIFQDYKFARHLILRMQKEWDYQIDDKVFDKIRSNKKRRGS